MDSPFNVYPAKGRYMWEDMARCCAAQGLAWQKPSGFPRGSLRAARITVGSADASWAGDLVRAVFAANFAQDRDIAGDAVITAILDEIGQDAGAVLASAQSAEVKAALRAQTEAALARGVFGAPSFTVGGDLFWGNDPLEMALSAAR